MTVPDTTDLPNNRPSKRRVLVIHQQQPVMDDLRPLLERHGFEVLTAESGMEGVTQAYQALPDAIVSWVQVPEVNGYQICRLLKADPVLRRIPVILVSDCGEKIDKFWGVKAGADDLINTDELRTRLVKKLNAVLEIYNRLDLKEKTSFQAEHAQTGYNIRTRLSQILDASLVETTLMVEFRNLSDLVHDPTLLNYMLFSLLESVLEYDAAAIFYNDRGKGPRTVTFNFPDGKAQSAGEAKKMAEALFGSLKEKSRNPAAFELLETEIIGEVKDEAPPSEYQTLYTKDFMLDNELIGSIAFYAGERVDYSKIFPLYLIEEELQLLMKLRHMYSQAESLAITDALTGLLNHKHFMTVLQQEFKSSQRYETELSVAFIEIGDLKQLNEAHGHAFGDDVLQKVSTLTEKCFRTVDTLARYGNKQLGIIFPKTSREDALIPLERFRQQLAELTFEANGKPVPVKIHIALAGLSPQTETLMALIGQVDSALVAAKGNGQNHIEIYATK